ncbi:hypothetical protein ONZ45_g13673 [Pleurotus djamor]|nr:hypothetical protein ONZ45_g13673 [Pleurotus djamor]
MSVNGTPWSIVCPSGVSTSLASLTSNAWITLVAFKGTPESSERCTFELRCADIDFTSPLGALIPEAIEHISLSVFLRGDLRYELVNEGHTAVTLSGHVDPLNPQPPPPPRTTRAQTRRSASLSTIADAFHVAQVDTTLLWSSKRKAADAGLSPGVSDSYQPPRFSPRSRMRTSTTSAHQASASTDSSCTQSTPLIVSKTLFLSPMPSDAHQIVYQETGGFGEPIEINSRVRIFYVIGYLAHQHFVPLKCLAFPSVPVRALLIFPLPSLTLLSKLHLRIGDEDALFGLSHCLLGMRTGTERLVIVPGSRVPDVAFMQGIPANKSIYLELRLCGFIE